MSPELLRDDWALVVAAGVALLVVLFLLVQKASVSAPAELRRVRRKLARERSRLRRAERAVTRAQARLARLQRHARNTKPRRVQEAGGALEDARALARIAADQVMIAENHVRRIIHEEFAPAKQERLRRKYLPDAPPDKRPFSF